MATFTILLHIHQLEESIRHSSDVGKKVSKWRTERQFFQAVWLRIRSNSRDLINLNEALRLSKAN